MTNHTALGDYQIIKQVGQGVLGQVLLAEHRFLKKQYLLKVLPEELATSRHFVQRFEEGVTALAQLQHPHIVKMHNVSFAQGVYFLVTDCIVDAVGEMTHLGHFMNERRQRLNEEDLVQLLRQIADALDYAHQKDAGKGMLTHLGLKLSNVFIAQDKGKLRAHLADFGLSRIIGVGNILSRLYKALAEALSITPVHTNPATGEDLYPNVNVESARLSKFHQGYLQSYRFLAPEQKVGDDPRGLDAKVDTYAFGVLAYYLIAADYPEGIFAMPSEIAPEYKLNWDKLVLSCLQHNPDKRPSLLLPLLDDLERKTVVSKLDEVDPHGIVKLPKIDVPQPQAIVNIQHEMHITQYTPQQKDAKLFEPILSDSVKIPGGNYWRGNQNGNRDEMPRHQIRLKSFWIDVHPVSNEQFVRYLEYLGGEKDAQHHDVIRLRESRIRRSAGKIIIESGYAKHPVVGVTWYGAMAYAKWVGKRLPTEAEWEIAASCGTELLYPTGNTIEKSQANFFSSDTTAVMSYAPNAYGLYDMAGNVYEWCQDWYSYNYYEVSAQEPDNPKGPMQGVYRVLRGGCWKSLKEDLRSSHRHRNNPGTMNSTYGFRCAKDDV